MVVLSIGMLPNGDALQLTQGPDLETTVDGFLPLPCPGQPPASHGIFSVGSATGPMGIAESISSAGQGVNSVVDYLNIKKG